MDCKAGLQSCIANLIRPVLMPGNLGSMNLISLPSRLLTAALVMGVEILGADSLMGRPRPRGDEVTGPLAEASLEPKKARIAGGALAAGESGFDEARLKAAGLL
jgi:hypothetical protein